MKLLDALRAEHVVIERVAGALRTFAARRAAGAAVPSDGDGFLRFFRGYSGGFHHAREEDVLFPALTRHAELAPGSGPIASLLDQHRSMEATLAAAAPLLSGALEAPGDAGRLVDLTDRYARALWAHVDAENSVLLPESEERLRRAGVLELDDREPDAAERAACAEGERLVRLYPPLPDPGSVRGEGCVVCPSYGTTCRGVEREWWSDEEWEEFADHLG